MARKITNIETALKNAFNELEIHNGWSTGTPKTMEYNCCQSCSWGNFNGNDNVLFYHIQDLDYLREVRRDNKDTKTWNINYPSEARETYQEYLFLAWQVQSEEMKNLMLDVLTKHRINVEYDGTTNTRLRVSMAATDVNEGTVKSPLTNNVFEEREE